MGNSMSGTKSTLIAYKLPNPDASEESTSQNSSDQSQGKAKSLLGRFLGAARRITPQSRRSQCEEGTTIAVPKAYNGLYEVIRDFDLLNVEDIQDNQHILRIRRRAQPLQPLLVKKRASKMELRAQGIITLTPNIDSLSYLHTLDLSDNHLTFLPDSIGRITFLQRLGLAGNNLQYLPDSIGDLMYLRSIDLARNHLTSLPETMGRLKKLRKLLVGHNYLTALPSCITELPKLTYLFVENNYSLKTLPGKICHLSRLHFFEVMGCDMLTTQDKVAEYELAKSHTGTPSLYEWCLRALLIHDHNSVTSLPNHLERQARQDFHVCDYCNGPYFWHSVTKCRILNHPDDTICLEYNMCRQHWKDEKSRVRHLFHTEIEPIYDDDWKPKEPRNVMHSDHNNDNGSEAARRFIIDTPAA